MFFVITSSSLPHLLLIIEYVTRVIQRAPLVVQRLPEHLSSSPFVVVFVLFISSNYILTFLVLCCTVHHDFCVISMFRSYSLPLCMVYVLSMLFVLIYGYFGQARFLSQEVRVRQNITE